MFGTRAGLEEGGKGMCKSFGMARFAKHPDAQVMGL
jgi:hypothetical protein